MTRAYNTATTQQNSGGAVAGVTAGKNAVINGAFDIWQRGTSFTSLPNTSTFTADRFYCYGNSLAAGITVSRQATNDTTNLPFIQYAARVARDSGITSTQQINLLMDIETVNSIPFAGKTVTLSFYARAGANFSPSGSLLRYQWRSGTGTDQRMGNGYTSSTQIASDGSVALTTTWQRFTITGTMVATATQMGLQLFVLPTGTAGANDWYEITGMQIEAGSVATPFSRAGGTIAGELAACQRYYWRNSGAVYNPMGPTGYTTQATAANGYMILPTTMRVTPTSIDFANMTWRQINGNGYTVTGLTISSTATNKVIRVDVIASGGGMALNIWGFLETDGYNNGVFGLSAEI
jgi:hypothetical protein